MVLVNKIMHLDTIFVDSSKEMTIMGLMKLNDYIKLIEVSQGKAAKQLGIKRQYLNQVIHGTKPGDELVKKIRVWSNGAVKINDLPGWEDWEKFA